MTEQLVNYNITDAAIREMREQYMRLRIVDLDDKDGAKAVSAARRAVKAKRCEVERLRKELKEDALKWGRKVDSEAKRITEMLLPIERHLEDEEARIEQERARIKAEDEARAEAERQEKLRRIDLRFAELAKYGGYTGKATVFQIGDLSEMEFDDLLEEARARWEKAEAERRAEEQRLEQVRKEQEAERERIAEERRVIEAEKWKLAEEKMATPPAELPSVIEMINEFRDHNPYFLKEVEGEVIEPMYQRFQVHTSNGHVFHSPNCEKLFSSISQWIDEIACEGDTLEIMMFRMTDAQYEDLVRSIDAKEDQ